MNLNQLVLELGYEDKVTKEIVEALKKNILKRVEEMKGLAFQVVEGDIGWSRD